MTHSLTSEGSDASEDGTGRGTPIVAVHENQRGEITTPPTMGALNVGGGKPGQGYPCVVTPLAIRGRDEGAELEARPAGSPANSLRSAGGGGGGSQHALVAIQSSDTPVGVAENQQGELRESDTVGALSGGGGKPGQGYQAVRHETIVRRLTEMECERLQGYPDGWTEGQSASARYRQLGNSVAVPCVEWIARRLIAVDQESQ